MAFIRAAGAGAAGTAFPVLSAAQSLTVVKIAAALEDDATPVLYAIDHGLFKKAGLDVQIQGSESGAAAAAAVAGGSLQLAKSSLTALVGAHERGIPFSLVAPSGLYTSTAPVAALIVPKDSPIESGADFRGKTVSASSLKDLIAVATMAWIDQHGGDSRSVKIVELPSSAVPAALEGGKIDAATTVYPALAEALAGGKSRILGYSFSAIAKRFLIAAYFANDDYIAKNGDVLRRFNEVLHDAILYTNSHHAQTLPLIAKWSKIPMPILRSMVRSTSATTLVPADIQPVIEAAVKYKIVKTSFPAQEMIAKI